MGQSEGLCFGLIGAGSKRFCHNGVACRIKTHSTKFHIEYNSGWFIAARDQQGTQNPSAFITPFLDLAKITEDTLAIVKGLDNKRTTAEWEVFIMAAQAEWEEFDAQRPLRAVMEQSSGEGGDDKPIGSMEGELFNGCYFFPEEFEWKKAPKAPVPLKLTRWKGEEAKGNTIIADKVKDLQAAVEDLHVLYGDVSKALQDQLVEVLDYIWLSVAEVIKAIDCLNVWVWLWKEVIGDFNVLHEERGLMDMSSELANTLSLCDAFELDFASGLDKMSQRLDLWEDDNVCNLTHISRKLKRLMVVQPAPLPAPPTVAPMRFSLTLSTPIMYDNGIQVGVLGGVLGKLNTLRAKNIKFGERLNVMRVDLMAQGGVMFGRHKFTSEIQVLQVALAECPGGEAFALFVDPVSIFCHNAQYSPGSNWQKNTKAMEELGVMLFTDCKVVVSYNMVHSWWFTEGKLPIVGKVIAAFATANK